MELEQRVFVVTGLATLSRDDDLADENMSTVSDESKEKMDPSAQEHKIRVAWKKIIHSMNKVPAKKAGQVRDHVARAITAARKAGLGNVVSSLRTALLQYQPDAAGDCKKAALAVLEKYGGYEEEDDDGDEEEENDDGDKQQTEVEVRLPSNLCGEAMVITGSLGGDEGANRIDWRDGVKSCKTLSRFAALSTAFAMKATDLLTNLIDKRNSMRHVLQLWRKEQERRSRSRNGTKHKMSPMTLSAINKRSEVWTEVRHTHDLCMVQLDDSPWWPAKRCVPKDEEIASLLPTFKSTLVSVVGEGARLRLVQNKKIKDFTGKPIESDGESHSKDIRSQLEDCLGVARRIERGSKRLNSRDEFPDEKKSVS